MRVIHVITRLIVGGAQENTIASVRGLIDRHQVDGRLISGPTSGPEGSLESALSGWPGLTRLPELVRSVNPWLDWKAERRLTAHFRQARPDLVHTHSGKAGVLGRLAARRAGVPIIVHTIHGPSFGTFQGPMANLLFRSAERWVARMTTHFVTVAHAMSQQYLAAGIGSPDRYTRILSGFDLKPFLGATNDPALRRQFGIKPDDLVVGTVARLFKLKGHDAILAAAPALVAKQPRIKFLWVGDGAWRERLQNRARELGLEERIIFTGLVPPSEVPRLMGIMDMLVHLSRREGLARALPQALAAAKPVIAYDLDGAGEVCLDDQTGFLIAPGDDAQLAGRLLQLAGDPALRARLGARGRDLVSTLFPVEKMVDDLYALYQRLLSGRNGEALP